MTFFFGPFTFSLGSLVRKLSSKSKEKKRLGSSSEVVISDFHAGHIAGEVSDCNARKPRRKPSRKEGTSPPARTRPYEAPYFFPTPNSEDAFNYAQRIRTEMRLPSSPPASSKSFPDVRPQTAPHKVDSQEDMPILSHTATMPVQSAPAHKTAFSQKIFSRPLRHRKSASTGSTSDLHADEFGFATVAPVIGEGLHGRHVRLVPERAASSPGPRIMNPLPHPFPPRPILKHSV